MAAAKRQWGLRCNFQTPMYSRQPEDIEIQIKTNLIMKKIIISLMLICMAALAFAQTGDADKILGTYMSENKTGKVQVTRQNGKYIGTLIWTSIENAKDEKNPDAALKSRTLKGTVILKDMTYVDGVWKNGTIYDPESGNTYKATIKLKSDGNLTLRGYIGVPALGRNSTWTRVK